MLVFQHAAFPEADPDAPENPAYAGCVWEFILREGAPCGLRRVWILCEAAYWADVDDVERAAAGQFLGHQIAADERVIPCVVSSAWKGPEAVRVLAHQTRVLLLEATLKTEKDPELAVYVNTGLAALHPIHATDRFIRPRLEEGRAGQVLRDPCQRLKKCLPAG